jgi:hypothetical protein
MSGGRCDEILDQAAARIVTGPGPYALLTTGALTGADERLGIAEV